MQYRQKLIPSGAHKAYIAALVLKDIAQAGLAVFLPDQDVGKRVVNTYNEVLRIGARAHIGSRYYTDEPSIFTQGDVDDFLSLAAYYVQHKMATSSLAASPHLDLVTADAADPRWKTIIDGTIRMGALGAPIEQVTAYLKLTGTTGYNVDISNEEGIQAAVKQNANFLAEISALFR